MRIASLFLFVIAAAGCARSPLPQPFVVSQPDATAQEPSEIGRFLPVIQEEYGVSVIDTTTGAIWKYSATTSGWAEVRPPIPSDRL